MVSILDDIEVQKRDRRIKQVTATDAESIFDLIESDLVDVDFDGTGEKEAEDE